MARSDRFYIGQLNGPGLQTNVRPYAIPDNAFAQLQNAYVFRGRVRKRFGGRLMEPTSVPTAGYESLPSRLRINIGTTNGAGTLGAPVSVPGTVQGAGVMFSIGDQIYTCTVSGAPATMINTGAGTVTYDSAAKTFTVTGAAATTAIYFYPCQPVMGLVNYEQSTVNQELLYAFDTQFAYQFTSAGWDRLGSAIWTGSNSDFFWATNWQGINQYDRYLFVTNYSSTDRIKYWSGSAWTQNTAGAQVGYSPVLNGTFRLHSCRIILPFKDRLIALNTIENEEGSSVGTTAATTGNFSGVVAGTFALGQNFLVGNTLFTIASTAAGAQAMTVKTLPGITTVATATFNFATGALVITGNNTNPSTTIYYLPNSGGTQRTFVNRCRFTWNNSPIAASGTEPTSTPGWIDTVQGFGGYIDAPTNEAIVTAQFLYDRLIVYFERSTWELVYTGNQVLPFTWQQINTELGAESTFSQVPFDKVVLAIGDVGVHACSGTNVERVDQNIPQKVFDFHNADNGTERIVGIRDFFVEMVYWSIPDNTRDSTYPFNNQVLTYNYKTGSWGINDDSITAFGYFQAATSASDTWQQRDITWADATDTWRGAPLQAYFRNVVAGNQQGYVFIVDADEPSNCEALQITNVTLTSSVVATIKCYNHNLVEGYGGEGDYIYIQNMQGITELNDMVFPVNSVTDADTFTIRIDDLGASGTYTGGGTITRVSNIDIHTKQYNFYVDQGRNSAINKIDFFLDKTSGGEFTVDYFASSSELSMVDAGIITGALLGTSVVETSPYPNVTLENSQNRLWHTLYPCVNGESVQLRIYMSEGQLLDYDIASSDFALHAMVIYANPTGTRLQ